MTDKWKHFDDWYIRLPNGITINLNTKDAADWALSLVERVEALEARAKKSERARGRKRAGADDGDE